jgi:hypothetical protein
MGVADWAACYSPADPVPGCDDQHLGCQAKEVTLACKWAKSRTRGRKLHLTGAKMRVGRARKSRSDLEQELRACRREIAHAREPLVEATKQQTATSEMLRLISNSPIQSVLDAVAENACATRTMRRSSAWRTTFFGWQVHTGKFQWLSMPTRAFP